MKKNDGASKDSSEKLTAAQKRAAKRRQMEAKIEQLKAQIAKDLALEGASNRKRENKLKVMAGACVLEMVKKDPELFRRFRSSLDAFITRPKERVVLDFFDEAVKKEEEGEPAEMKKAAKAVA
jgi:hypothetical protein